MINVKKIRKSKGWSQSELANKLGVSRTTVTMWESGGKAPRSGTVVRLADVLNCTIDELFGRAPPDRAEEDSA